MTFLGGEPLVSFERRPRAIQHDHVGHMIFVGDTCACIGEGGCGQEWEMTYKAAPRPDGSRELAGWRPLPPQE